MSMASGAGKYPQVRESYGIAATAATIVLLEYSYLYSIYPILIFYALWLPLIFYRHRFVPKITGDVIPIYLLMTLCLSSSLWSSFPDVTGRTGFEFVTMMLITVVISRVVSDTAFLKGVGIGAAITLLITLKNGGYDRDYFSGTYALVGLLGSKNQVGFIAEMGIYSAIVYFFTPDKVRNKMMFVLLPMAVCLISLALSHSATSVISLAIALVISYATWLLTKSSRSFRSSAAALAFMMVTFIVTVGAYAGWQESLFKTMGKNSTMTGRTYLWSEGIKVGMQRPWLGHGYNGFWVPNQPQAERYWGEFQISGRTGFHFHNMYVQTLVDMGVAGLSLIVFLILMSWVKSFQYIMRRGADIKGMFCFGMASMFIIRSFVEVDFLGAFSAGDLLFYSLLPRLAANNVELTQEQKDEARGPLMPVIRPVPPSGGEAGV